MARDLAAHDTAGAPTLYALVPAAGLGARSGLGHNKAWAELAGHSLVAWTLRSLLTEPRLAGLVLVGRPEELGRLRAEGESCLAAAAAALPLLVCAGGETRQASVLLGLEALAAALAPAECAVARVLIHDAARCLLDAALLRRAADCLLSPRTEAMSCALAVTDSTALVAEERPDELETVLARARLRALQTPQGFPLESGLDWHRRAAAEGLAVLDDGGLARHYGATVRLVEGSAENFKLTQPGDFARAEAILEARRAREEGTR